MIIDFPERVKSIDDENAVIDWLDSVCTALVSIANAIDDLDKRVTKLTTKGVDE